MLRRLKVTSRVQGARTLIYEPNDRSDAIDSGGTLIGTTRLKDQPSNG